MTLWFMKRKFSVKPNMLFFSKWIMFWKHLYLHLQYVFTHMHSHTCTHTHTHTCACVHAKSLQYCLTLCNPLDYSLPDSPVHGILRQDTGVGCHALLQEIFPIQGSNLLAGRFFTTSTIWGAYTHTHKHTHTCTCVCTHTHTYTQYTHIHTIYILRPLFPSVQ